MKQFGGNIGGECEVTSMMKVAIVTSSVSRSAGGLFDAVKGLVLELPNAGISPQVYGLEDEHSAEDRDAWRTTRLITSRTLGPRSIGFSPAMRNSLLRSDADLVHTHGIWMHPSAQNSACNITKQSK